MPEAALPRRDEVSPSVRLEFPDQGGHAAFVSAPFPGNLDWMPRRVTAFFAEAIAGRETGSPAYANGIMPDPGVLLR
jgi:predicted alpha/beta-fold hydrolase